ncbi:MAG: nucleotide sugar dehydrogenase [Alphaproteobacteria bacterium]
MEQSDPGRPQDNALKERLRRREAHIGVIGLGYVGLPLVRAFGEKGFETTGFDVDGEKVDRLNSGSSYIRHIPSDAVRTLLDSGRFRPTADFGRLRDVDVIVICVPTPLTRHREPDISYILNTGRTIAAELRRGQLVVLESTTYPGTTMEGLKPVLEESGLKSGNDFYLAYSPEREDPGNSSHSAASIPKVVGGDGPAACELACLLYDEIAAGTIPVSNTEAAEAVKLTENIFRAVNIALVNELKMVYARMGIDVWEVIEAAKSKPFGYMPFYPGPGLGGHCIPIDPYYLAWKARQYEVPTRFIELAGEINSAMPAHVVQVLSDAVNIRFTKSLKGARILLVGIAYKKNVDDVRESPGLRLIKLLEDKGAAVDYYDPYVPSIPKTRDYADLVGRRSVSWQQTVAQAYDAALICTDHDGVDYQALVRAHPLVVDTRNATNRARDNPDRIVMA